MFSAIRCKSYSDRTYKYLIQLAGSNGSLNPARQAMDSKNSKGGCSYCKTTCNSNCTCKCHISMTKTAIKSATKGPKHSDNSNGDEDTDDDCLCGICNCILEALFDR